MSNTYLSMPERHEAMSVALRLVRQAEERIKINVTDKGAREMLKSALDILEHYKKADRYSYLQDMQKLELMMKDVDYPHSIKTWFEAELAETLRDDEER